MKTSVLLSTLMCCHLVVIGAYQVKYNGVSRDNPDNLSLKMKKSVNISDMKLNPKPGTFVNCGDPSTEAHMDWTPTKLRMGDTSHVNFHIISPVNLSKGHMTLDGYRPGQTDPFYHSTFKFNCDDIHLYAKFVPCPFQKGQRVDVKHYKVYIKPSTVLPTGEFYMKFLIMTKSWKEAVCLYGHVIVLDDYDHLL